MSYNKQFHPKNGIGPLWTWIQETAPRLRNRTHVIEIKELSGTRTSTINAYYWKIVVVAYISEMGLVNCESEKHYVHYDVLSELRQVDDPLRPGKTKTKRTQDMTGSEFWKYLDRCNHQFHGMFNYTYPPPKNAGYDIDRCIDIKA